MTEIKTTELARHLALYARGWYIPGGKSVKDDLIQIVCYVAGLRECSVRDMLRAVYAEVWLYLGYCPNPVVEFVEMIMFLRTLTQNIPANKNIEIEGWDEALAQAALVPFITVKIDMGEPDRKCLPIHERKV